MKHTYALLAVLLASTPLTSVFADEVPVEKTTFEQNILKDLVKPEGDKLAKTDVTPKDYYAIYYSAHWCGPCRKFTPQLVDFYNENTPKHDNFEVIFVSSDKSAQKMQAYIDEAHMPWPALEYGKKKEFKGYTKHGIKWIPSLVIVDREGNVLATSIVDGEYIHPSKVMANFQQILDEQDS
ncbi:thioredoxin-like domain-containing protein [Cerasicoccus maritimus]|uniref:thioredoxin-like domain-containing protein n=1 Tax=Cerasicoccus maritimus TaxID=490089 RepID=UPI0028525F40|nr:thioredoxin-like domain-containing protein [Cerasicoccus maritimus]